MIHPATDATPTDPCDHDPQFVTGICALCGAQCPVPPNAEADALSRCGDAELRTLANISNGAADAYEAAGQHAECGTWRTTAWLCSAILAQRASARKVA